MKILVTALIALTLLTSQLVFSHSDHAHGPISESAAESLALDVASNLSTRDAGLGFGQLAKTWMSLPAENVAISKKGPGYYIVAVQNESDKKTLYILMSEVGEVYDANFSGEFKGLK